MSTRYRGLVSALALSPLHLMTEVCVWRSPCPLYHWSPLCMQMNNGMQTPLSRGS